MEFLAQVTTTNSSSPLSNVLSLALGVLIIASMWKIFAKAGQPGWTALVPIYNIFVLLKIINKPGWWIILMLIPLVNFIAAAIVGIELAKVFGKSAVFGIFGLFLFSIIGYPILAFGDAQYKQPGTASTPQNSGPASA